VGGERDPRGGWIPAQRPERLRAGVEANLRGLEMEQVPVVNLRLPRVPPASCTTPRLLTRPKAAILFGVLRLRSSRTAPGVMVRLHQWID
jgi:hypothetical protein